MTVIDPRLIHKEIRDGKTVVIVPRVDTQATIERLLKEKGRKVRDSGPDPR